MVVEERLPIHANVRSCDEAAAVGEVPYSGDNALDNRIQLASLLTAHLYVARESKA